MSILTGLFYIDFICKKKIQFVHFLKIKALNIQHFTLDDLNEVILTRVATLEFGHVLCNIFLSFYFDTFIQI